VTFDVAKTKDGERERDARQSLSGGEVDRSELMDQTLWRLANFL